MSLLAWVVFAWAATASLVWCAVCLRNALPLRRLRLLAEERADRTSWPTLSIVIAACDEEGTMEAALQSLRAEDYPGLEIVVVDDRSTDATGAILDRVAAEDPRVRAVHVRDLPSGWLGKVHALDLGVRHAQGEWLLFTDADVHFTRGALRKAIARCEAEALDHLAVLPEVRTHSLWEEIVLLAVGEMFVRITRAAHIGGPNPDAYTGIGAFNLVRRAALDRTEGFPWLRMEVVDDVGLGLLLRRAGARAGFAIGTGEVALEWYPSLGAMARGLEKNMFGMYARYQYGTAVATLVATWLVLFGPAVALVQRAVPGEWMLGVAAYASMAAYALALARKVRRPVLPFLMLPLGHLVVPLILMRSALACWSHGGVVWRGTTYPLAELRAAQRVHL